MFALSLNDDRQARQANKEKQIFFHKKQQSGFESNFCGTDAMVAVMILGEIISKSCGLFFRDNNSRWCGFTRDWCCENIRVEYQPISPKTGMVLVQTTG
jgi:hypothetical protein